MDREDLIIATRGSRLALVQSEQIAACLRAAHPGLSVGLLTITTSGDRNQSAPLPAIGGKGLFTEELEQALLRGDADLAVHSLKDLPTELPAGLTLAAVPPRDVPLDAVVLPVGVPAESDDALRLLEPGFRVGTSSLRRQAFLRHRRPDLGLEPVRGNLDTRLRKLDEGQFDALVLAAAGLRRLGWAERISGLLAAEVSVPAPGQGALGIEARADARVLDLLGVLEDPAARAAVTAERAFLAALGTGCQTPCGAYARPEGDGLVLLGAVARPDGTELMLREAAGPASDAAALGHGLAQALLAEGAARLLEG
ncbi:MAG: hydroxymethylbilane synthase [Armatimonadetes bacterium]|nr:hydroxymethylbilane synthase [Armatimonadota bacterium]